MRSVTDGDTLFLRAEQIIAYNSIDSVYNAIADSTGIIRRSKSDTAAIPGVSNKDSTAAKERDTIEFLIADGSVRIYRDDFQAVCDSLNYNLVDSIITFIRQPMIWSNGNQLEGDTIEVFMKENKINRMFLQQRSFVISQDSVSNFNQIKGRQIVAFFDEDTSIKQVAVEGNGESIYYALDDRNKVIGLNRVECSRMTLNFFERKVKRISFVGKPESRLIPPVEINGQDTRLDGFDWKSENKPTREQVLGHHTEAVENPEKSKL
jgi:hypothetical protein